MLSKEVLSALAANPAFQELHQYFRARRQGFLEQLPREPGSDAKLVLSGRCLELEDTMNFIDTTLKGRHDLETTSPEEEL